MKIASLRLAALLLGPAVAGSALADLGSYSQDFEGLNMAAGDALSGDGWLVFGNVFSPTWTYLYGYGSFPAPNGGPGFSALATGEAGPEQGSQYLNAYSDYNNGDHANGNIIEANVFQERTIGAADLGKIYRFEFDYKASSTAGPAGATNTMAFIKVLNPAAGWALVAFPTVNTTGASTTEWTLNSTIDLAIDAGWTNHVLQFGFLSQATNYEGSGVFYDNVSFGAVPEPATLAVLGLGAAALLRRRR